MRVCVPIDRLGTGFCVMFARILPFVEGMPVMIGDKPKPLPAWNSAWRKTSASWCSICRRGGTGPRFSLRPRDEARRIEKAARRLSDEIGSNWAADHRGFQSSRHLDSGPSEATLRVSRSRRRRHRCAPTAVATPVPTADPRHSRSLRGHQRAEDRHHLWRRLPR